MLTNEELMVLAVGNLPHGRRGTKCKTLNYEGRLYTQRRWYDVVLGKMYTKAYAFEDAASRY